MTDRPTLADLDTEPDDTPWCCNGNAEDCALCTDPNPPYPWICPGHPDTDDNRERVHAAQHAGHGSPCETHLTGACAQPNATPAPADSPLWQESEAWRRKAIRRALKISKLQGVIQAVTDLAGEEITARTEWGDGYRAALADLQEVLREFGQMPPAPAHNAGPSVAECKADDRKWWNDKHAGEGQ